MNEPEKEFILRMIALYPQLKAEYESEVWGYIEEAPPPQEHEWWKEFEEKKPPAEASTCAQLMSLESSIFEFVHSDRFDLEVTKNIFHSIEEFLVSHPEQKISTNFKICFFENLLNRLGWQKSRKLIWEDILGPISMDLCKQNDDFWGTNILKYES
jgi:hypothetical protein